MLVRSWTCPVRCLYSVIRVVLPILRIVDGADRLELGYFVGFVHEAQRP